MDCTVLQTSIYQNIAKLLTHLSIFDKVCLIPFGVANLATHSIAGMIANKKIYRSFTITIL